jgi:hypothetical protein
MLEALERRDGPPCALILRTATCSPSATRSSPTCAHRKPPRNPRPMNAPAAAPIQVERTARFPRSGKDWQAAAPKPPGKSCSTAASRGRYPPTPRSTRSSRSACSCRAPRTTCAGDRDRARDARAHPGARRRHQPVRPDRGRGAGHRQQQVPEPGGRLRRGSDDGDGAAGDGAGSPERLAQAARRVVSGRRQHRGPVHHRRHGRQQLLRLALPRLRQHGAQRAGDRRHPGGRHRGHFGTSAPWRDTAAARARTDRTACAPSPNANATRSRSAWCRR